MHNAMNSDKCRRLWRDLDRSRRKAILSALQRGDRLADSMDAQLAVYLARQRQRTNWVFLAGPLVLALLILVVRLIAGVTFLGSALSALLGGSFLAVFAVPAWRKWDRVLSQTISLNVDHETNP